MQHVFLSFKTEQVRTAAQLGTALREAGFKVWWQADIQCGGEWHSEIDQAIKNAGCVVVLWSHSAMKSPWVKHEASQAIANGVYAPVRIEAMEIPSPYDRIQAPSLVNWNGEQDHPGIQSLFTRIEELIPVDLSIARRGKRWLKSHFSILAAGSMAVVAITLLTVITVDIGRLENRQINIEDLLRKQLQTISSLEAVVTIRLPPEMDGVAEYRELLLAEVLPAENNYDSAYSLPMGTMRHRDLVFIEPSSAYWPSSTLRHSMKRGFFFSDIRFLIENIAVSIDFCHGPREFDAPFLVACGVNDRRPNMVLEFGSLQQQRKLTAIELRDGDKIKPRIRWNTKTGDLSVDYALGMVVSSTSAIRNIFTVDDLEKSDFTISLDVLNGNNEKLKEDLAKLRTSISLQTMIFQYSGRTAIFPVTSTLSFVDSQGHSRYSGRFPETFSQPKN